MVLSIIWCLIPIQQEDSAGTYPPNPRREPRQVLPVLTTRLAHLADAQSERAATATQSGKSQGETPHTASTQPLSLQDVPLAPDNW